VGQRYSIDIWHGCLNLTRQYLRGWNANKVRDNKKAKKEILDKLRELDEMGDQTSESNLVPRISARVHLGADLSQRGNVLETKKK
jgi:hypothetical protein